MPDSDNTNTPLNPNETNESSHTSDILLEARRQFAEYDVNAGIHQRIFHRRQFLILLLGVLAVILALSQTEFIGTEPPIPEALLDSTEASIQEAEAALSSLPVAARDSAQAVIDQGKAEVRLTRYHNWFRYGIIVVPIAISILIAVSNKLKAGPKWILLRSAAESIKREIFLYRARAGLYDSSTMSDGITRDTRLAEQLKSISDRLMKSVANEAGIARFKQSPEFDEAMSQVKSDNITSAQVYMDERLEDQLGYFAKRSDKMGLRLKLMQWLIYIAGGIGTLLAAIGLEIWVALTTALGTAFVTYLEYRQMENTLLLNNQVVSELVSVKNWWLALPSKERNFTQNRNLLVIQSEDILMSEQAGWVKNMTDALAQLHAKQEKAEEEGVDINKLFDQIKELRDKADQDKEDSTKMLRQVKQLLEGDG